VAGHDFILLDDETYILENFRVRGGLTWEGAKWAFTAFHTANWHPLTWLSHMLDVELFGMAPGPHHLVNAALHSCNSVLLFLLLSGMTGALWRSAAAAAVFAVHPLHVESVAWVSERKDLLCALFFLLSIAAHVRYARRGGSVRYLGLVLAFSLALLSKPMAVTLPFVLLLLDFWPLGRMALGQEAPGASRGFAPVPLRRLLLEKVPLLAMSAASSAVTWIAQEQGGAVAIAVPFGVRAANAGVSYVAYLWKTVWPSGLAPFYPYPTIDRQGMLLRQASGAVLLLAGVTGAALRTARRAPFLCTGWLWYLGMLVPVIGLLQVGSQAMADRYMYLPLAGVALAVAWGMPALLPSFRYRNALLGTAAGAAVLSLAAATFFQARYWKDTATLFSHALLVTENNWMAHGILGSLAFREGNLVEAESRLRESMRIRPEPVAMVQMGNILLAKERAAEAEALYRNAIRIRPSEAMAHYNLGLLLAKRDHAREAIAEYHEALHHSPDDFRILTSLGTALLRTGNLPEAVRRYREAHRLSPENPLVNYNLGVALEESGNIDEAIARYRTSIRVNPGYGKAQNNLGRLLEMRGRSEEAMEHYGKAVQLAPGDIVSRLNLGFSLVRAGRSREAAAHFREALKIRPGDPGATRGLELALGGGKP
jgi:Flp pilus assembly protein TadD